MSIKKQISNYVQFISRGDFSESVASVLKQAESRKQSLESQLKNLKQRESDQDFMTPFTIQKNLGNLSEILNQDMPRANVFLRRLFPEPIRMKPMSNKKAAPSRYETAGRVNLTKLLAWSTSVKGTPRLKYASPRRLVSADASTISSCAADAMLLGHRTFGVLISESKKTKRPHLAM